ncbi:helix-turn-helix domain-containing protein [Bacillus toyonensis]|nr:helix-turn-helix domain-containing protein [Bacillus toyonensis]
MRGDRVKQLRKEMKWTQEELGNRVDLKKSTISEIENNKKDAGRKAITKIATVLNCTTDYLLGLTDDPRLNESEDNKTDELARKFAELVADLPKEEQENVWKQALMYVNFTKNKKND